VSYQILDRLYETENFAPLTKAVEKDKLTEVEKDWFFG
jgi:hypothetical protein